jgi:hypothetical protein
MSSVASSSVITAVIPGPKNKLGVSYDNKGPVANLLRRYLYHDVTTLCCAYLDVTHISFALQKRDDYRPISRSIRIHIENNQVYLYSNETSVMDTMVVLEAVPETEQVLVLCSGQFFRAYTPLTVSALYVGKGRPQQQEQKDESCSWDSSIKYIDVTVDEVHQRLYMLFESYIKVLDFTGCPVGELWDDFQEQDIYPTDLCVVDEEVYIVDGEVDHVYVYDTNGNPLRSWGGPGSQPGAFHIPMSICVIGKHLLCVADSRNHRLQIFTTQGVFVSQVSLSYEPRRVYRGSENTLWIGGKEPGCEGRCIIEQWQGE